MNTQTITDQFFFLSNDLLCAVGYDGCFKTVNPAWENTLGYGEDELLEKPVLDFIDPEDQDRTKAYFQSVRQNASSPVFQNRFYSKDGTYHWLSWSAYASENEQLIYAIARDINEQKARERKLERLADIVEHSQDAIISHTAMGIVISWNRGAETIYGFTVGEMLGHSADILLPEHNREELNQLMERIRGGAPVQQYETVHRRKSGKEFDVSLTYSPIFSSTQKLLGVSCIARDITAQKQMLQELMRHREELDKLVEQRTKELAEANVKLQRENQERKHAEEQMRRLAHKDSLTGINNRRRFFELIEQEFRRSRRYGEPLTLLMMDIDHFKPVNDNYGHSAGDKVLKAFAELGGQVFRGVDIFGRMGGEEFAVLLPETGIAGAKEVAERFRRRVEDMRVECNSSSIQITVSTGIAALTEQTATPEDLITQADKALYQAKDAGRNRWKVYE